MELAECSSRGQAVEVEAFTNLPTLPYAEAV